MSRGVLYAQPQVPDEASDPHLVLHRNPHYTGLGSSGIRSYVQVMEMVVSV